MTLTELRYIVALAREHHFGRAAEACFVSQPTLSVAVKKLEEELGVALFERGKTEVAVTPVGERIVEQARRVADGLGGGGRGALGGGLVCLPFEEPGVVPLPLYDEPFMVMVQAKHAWAKRKTIATDDLATETVLLLGAGHCFRHKVVAACAL